MRRVYAAAPREDRDHHAITLPPECTREIRNGWIVAAEVHEDYYTWVNQFAAVHPVHGIVCGDFETVVYASSKAGFKHFCKTWPVHEWDYWDI